MLGATHPNLVRDHGETYRLSLERLAKKNGVEKNVIFFNRFVDQDELLEFLGAADIYITPYLNKTQITSGTLAYSFGAGKAVISTPTGTPRSCSRTGAECSSPLPMFRRFPKLFAICFVTRRCATQCAKPPISWAER